MEIDVNQPLENPKLKELFARRRELMSSERQDAESYGEVMNQLYEEIVMNAHFLSVVQFSKPPVSKEGGTAVFQEETIMRFPMLTTEDKRDFYPAFIDWEELGAWEEIKNAQLKTLVLTFDDYASMILGNERTAGLVVNPFSDNMAFNREVIGHLKERKEILQTGHSQRRVTKDTPVHLGDPKTYPDAMVEAICGHARKEKAIQAIWLRLMEKEGEFSFLLVVDFSGEKEVVFNGIADVARAHLPQGMYIDMVSLADDFGRRATEDIEPFYRRKRGMFGLR